MDKVLKAGEDFHWLIVGDRCWGKGKSRAAAMAACRKVGGAAGVRYHSVYLVPPTGRVKDGGVTGALVTWDIEAGKPDFIVLVDEKMPASPKRPM